jgi:hypothetical protein
VPAFRQAVLAVQGFEPRKAFSDCNFQLTCDYHLLLDEHSEQIFAMTDEIAERARKIGGRTLRSISDISRHQRLKDNNDESVASEEMLAELNADNSVTAEVASSSLVVPAILSKAVRRNSLRPLRSRRIFEYRHVE